MENLDKNDQRLEFFLRAEAQVSLFQEEKVTISSN